MIQKTCRIYLISISISCKVSWCGAEGVAANFPDSNKANAKEVTILKRTRHNPSLIIVLVEPQVRRTHLAQVRSPNMIIQRDQEPNSASCLAWIGIHLPRSPKCPSYKKGESPAQDMQCSFVCRECDEGMQQKRVLVSVGSLARAAAARERRAPNFSCDAK